MFYNSASQSMCPELVTTMKYLLPICYEVNIEIENKNLETFVVS